MPAVEVSGLVVRYGPVVAVDGLTFAAEAGEVLALLGPNGAGKTSTVETLEGFRRPAAGSVQVLGRRPVDAIPQMGVMLQGGGLYPSMGPREALHLFAAYYDHPADPDELLERVGLAQVARTPWRRLSGGEKQRLSLALALVGRPKVAFLDEPTAGVDPAGRIVIRRIVRELAGEGVCVVLTTHELEEAERVADRVLIIDRGRTVAQGSVDEILREGAGDEIRFGGPPALDVVALAAHLGGAVTEVAPGEYVAKVAATPANVAALTAWLAERNLPLADLRAGRHRLEDVFLRLTGEGRS